MIKTYWISLALVTVSLVSTNVYADEVGSDIYPVQLIHSEVMSFPVNPDIFTEYLRRPTYRSILPTHIIYRLDCYTDGSGSVHHVKGIRDINRALTYNGNGILRLTLLAVAYDMCADIWEDRFDGDTLREGDDAWFF